MNVKKGLLTPTEERVMELFWNNEEPLGSRELLEMSDNEWSVEQISNILRALERKQMIEFCGKKSGRTRPDGKLQPVRQFRVCMTKGEYLVDIVGAKGVDKKFLYKVSAALVESIGEKEVISELEKIIRELEKKHE